MQSIGRQGLELFPPVHALVFSTENGKSCRLFSKPRASNVNAPQTRCQSSSPTGKYDQFTTFTMIAKTCVSLLICVLLCIFVPFVESAPANDSSSLLNRPTARAVSRSSGARIITEELRAMSPGMNPALYQVLERELRVGLDSISSIARSVTEARQIVQRVIQPRIVNGRTAGEWDNPFQVSLVWATISNNMIAHFCGGAVISSEHIVTAAHCVEGRTTREVQVLINTRRLDGSGQRFPIHSISVHPKYNPFTLDYDVAVIRIGRSAVIEFVDLAISQPRHNEGLLVTGWGRLSSGGPSPTDLHALQLPVIDESLCNSASSYNGDITPRMFCAGFLSGGRDSCQGDSGGPITGGIGNALLTGLVSWGIGCALPNYPGVYTKIADKEIREFVSSFAPPPVIPTFNQGVRFNVEGFGTATDVHVRIRGYARRIWGTRKYADLQATADAYCRGLGKNIALSWQSNSCGEDESSFVRYDPVSRQWESRASGSANNRGGYCRYPLLTSVQCGNDVRVTLSMGGNANSAGVGSLTCAGRSCVVRGNRPKGISCSVDCPSGSTVFLDCASNNSRRPVEDAHFTRGGSGRQTVVSGNLSITGICNFSD